MASSSCHTDSYSENARESFTIPKKFYDAFINHRGPDVKDSVAFALYDSLEEKGFWTFLDDQELQLGDSIESVIKKAIYSSSVQIAIFSPRYAESPWCLNELVDMLKTKALFIPVFCDVKPSDLRYPHKGAYKNAFAEHERNGRFSKKKLQKWKEALCSSSDISGHEFSTTNDDIEILCTKICLTVQKNVGKTFKGFPRYVEDAEAVASTSTSAQMKKCSLLPRDSRPVGIYSKVEQILRLLEDPKVSVIAVVGMGGLGKTFLLQNVNNKTKSSFENSIWLPISKSYSVKNLQRDLAFHIGLTGEIRDGTISEETAAELIHGCLEGKKSLIVLDDLWMLLTEDNLLDKLGLPADKDCKVIVSTRNRKVAETLSARIYEMENLSDEDSWKLFCVYAFPESEGNRPPPHVEEEGRKIVQQCGKLPLAIKTIASSLAKATRLSKWEYKRRQLERAIIPFGEHDPVMDILKLSYDSLPPHLKACFAYFSFFPEDCEIDCEYLIYLWIGEGLVPAGEEQWDMAWDWLDHLAQLCLLQLWEDRELLMQERRDYLTKYCKIHDLLHDLAIHLSRENKCVFFLEEASTFASGAFGCSRLLLTKKDIKDNALSQSPPTYLRTLSLAQNQGITRIPANFFTAMRGLRILDLSSTNISTLPDSVGKMILLKVLNLRRTRIEEVPECVRHLKGLLYLAMPKGNCKYLPAWISELKCLQHLECENVDHMPKGISALASLSTLLSGWLYLFKEENEFMRLEDLARMTQLQDLRLRIDHGMEMKMMEEGILMQLVKMRRLRIMNLVRQFPHFPEKMEALKNLESLRLVRFGVRSWICELANLRELILHRCACSDYGELRRMPNLVRLWLHRNFWSRELPKTFGKSGGFPQLRFLTISQFSELEEFPELEEGAMICLEQFRLWNYKKMTKVGGGLEWLNRLKEFNYWGSGTNEVREALKEGGEYWNKMKATNPYVIIDQWAT